MSGRKNNCEPRRCCDCGGPRWQYGRCRTCYRALDPAMFERLKNMSRRERAAEFEKITGQSERPRWEWAGDESALIEQTAKSAAGEKS